MKLVDPSDTVELRKHVIDAGITAFRSGGVRSVDLRAIAQAASIDVPTLEEAFPSWDLLMIAILDRWSGAVRRDNIVIAEAEGAVAFMRSLVVAAVEDPAMARTRHAFLGAAADPEHPARGWYKTQYAQALQDVALFFTRDIVAKREPRTVPPRHAAEQLVALYEGLVMQAEFVDEVDLPAAFDRAVARLRIGWATKL